MNYSIKPLPKVPASDLLRKAKRAALRGLRFQPRMKRAVDGLVTAPNENPPALESELVQRLVKSYEPAKRRQSELSGPYAPGAEWKVILENEWRTFRTALAAGDHQRLAEFLRNFFRNGAISGIWANCRMFEEFASLGRFAHDSRAAAFERQYATWREHLPTTSLSELDAPPIGNPWGYTIEGHLIYEPAFEYHLQASLFASALAGLQSPVVLEIGGGFGGLAYFLRKQIPEVTYIGFDLPENALIQAYYLQCAFPKARILTCREDLPDIDATTVAKYDFIILPNFMLPKVSAKLADLVVNVRSLSEMPDDTIAEYISQIDRIGGYLFFHENIYKDREDSWHGIPSPRFPPLRNFVLVHYIESRWPRYSRASGYPCRENLLLHRDAAKHRAVGA